MAGGAVRQDAILQTTHRMALLLAVILFGCTTDPSPGGNRLHFADKQFAVDPPPEGWEITKQPSTVISWVSRLTESTIQISAFEFTPPGPSYPALAELFFSSFAIGLRDRARASTAAITDQRAVPLDGKNFYRVLIDYEMSPTEGAKTKGRFLSYFLRTEKFYYRLSLLAEVEFYEKEWPVLEQMARSFTYKGVSSPQGLYRVPAALRQYPPHLPPVPDLSFLGSIVLSLNMVAGVAGSIGMG